MSTHHFPNPFELRFIMCFEVGPHLECLADRILSYLESPDMSPDELRAYADTKTREIVDALTATITTEHDEIMAALAAQGGASGLSDADIRAALDAQAAAVRDQLTPLISGVFDAAAPGGGGTVTPAPAPSPTPEPAPAPTPEPTPPPGTSPANPVTVTAPNAGQPPQTTVTPTEGQPVPSSVAP